MTLVSLGMGSDKILVIPVWLSILLIDDDDSLSNPADFQCAKTLACTGFKCQLHQCHYESLNTVHDRKALCSRSSPHREGAVGVSVTVPETLIHCMAINIRSTIMALLAGVFPPSYEMSVLQVLRSAICIVLLQKLWSTLDYFCLLRLSTHNRSLVSFIVVCLLNVRVWLDVDGTFSRLELELWVSLDLPCESLLCPV